MAESYRVHGWVLAIASPLALVGLANHPVASGTDLLAALRAMEAIGYINSIIHGFLMAMMVAVLFGFIGFSRRLGFEQPLVQAGFLAQCVGTFAALSAAIIDGWVYRRLAIAYVDTAADKVDLIRGLFNLSAAMVATWGRLWLIGLAAAVLLWSIVLMRREGPARTLGVFGVLAGGISAIGSLTGFFAMAATVNAMIFGALALWGMGVGVLLLRDKL